MRVVVEVEVEEVVVVVVEEEEIVVVIDEVIVMTYCSNQRTPSHENSVKLGGGLSAFNSNNCFSHSKHLSTVNSNCCLTRRISAVTRLARCAHTHIHTHAHTYTHT